MIKKKMARRLAWVTLTALFLAGGQSVQADDALKNEAKPMTAQNIIWNSSFECGVGSGTWGVVRRVGPNVPELWQRGGYRSAYCLSLVKPIGSRLYKIGDKPGLWRLTLMARSTSGTARLVVDLNNNNKPGSDKEGGINYYRRAFEVGEQWQTFSLDAQVGEVVRPYFHLELSGTGILVDDVNLYQVDPSAAATATCRPVQAVETGFVIPEITKIYLDGEKRPCTLLVTNNTEVPIETSVSYTIFDTFENPVRTEKLAVKLAGRETREFPVNLEDLKYGAYRLRSSWGEAPSQGDALVGLLPAVRHDLPTRWGCNASLDDQSLDFSIRMLKRLGMGFVSTMSTGSELGRWSIVETEPGKLNTRFDKMQKLKDNDLWVAAYMQAAEWPAWLVQKKPTNQEIIEAFGKYVSAYVKAYEPYVKLFHIEDEAERKPWLKDMDLYADLHKHAYDTAKKTAAEMGREILVSTNTVDVGWFGQLWDKIGEKYFDFLSVNFTPLPGWTERLLREQAKRNSHQEILFTPAVGQRCVMRQTTLIQDTPSAGVPPSTFVWQTLKTSWLSRPYGLEASVFAPVIHFGYYEIRVHDVAHYIPRQGWTGLECDNSPHAGFQAVTAMRSIIGPMQPVRRTLGTEVSEAGLPLGSDKNFEAYPFRNQSEAAVAFMPASEADLDKPHTISLPAAAGSRVYDLFANELTPRKNGERLEITVPVLPVYVTMPAAGLEPFLARLDTVKLAREAQPSLQRFETGPIVVQVDENDKGIFKVFLKKNGRLEPIINGIQTDVPFGDRMRITAEGNGIITSVRIDDPYNPPGRKYLALMADRDGLTFTVRGDSWSGDSPKTGFVRLMLSEYILDKNVTYYSRPAAGPITGSGGQIAHDFGKLTPTGPAAVPAGLSLKEGTALLDIANSYRVSFFAPAPGPGIKLLTPPGFQFFVQNGEAWLESRFQLETPPEGVKRIIFTSGLEIKGLR